MSMGTTPRRLSSLGKGHLYEMSPTLIRDVTPALDEVGPGDSGEGRLEPGRTIALVGLQRNATA